jgi:hypothetical protein
MIGPVDMKASVDAAKLTILVDNQASGSLEAEHGLSLWIEAAGRRILFDTGQGKVLAGNAAQLGVELECTDTLVISHGHYDHTGGLALVAQRSPQVELYGHPSLLVPRYSIRGGVVRDIAVPVSARLALECLPSRNVHWTSEARTIAPGVGVTGAIPRVTDYSRCYKRPTKAGTQGQAERTQAYDASSGLLPLTQDERIQEPCHGCVRQSPSEADSPSLSPRWKRHHPRSWNMLFPCVPGLRSGCWLPRFWHSWVPWHTRRPLRANPRL